MIRTTKDLRLHFKRTTGFYAPIGADKEMTPQATYSEYVNWLEDELVKCENIKHKFLPWENELQRRFKDR